MKGVFIAMNASFHGMILALGLILPLGAQNVFIFQQAAVAHRLWRVLPLVVSASLCDTLLIILAVTGVSAAVAGMPAVKMILVAAGTCFLFYMGWVTWNSKPASGDSNSDGLTAKRQIVFAVAVSLFNPHAILDTVGVIGTNSLTYDGQERWLFTGSCIFVSWVWFTALAVLGRILRRLDSRGAWQTLFNKGSALVMWVLAAYLGISLFA